MIRTLLKKSFSRIHNVVFYRILIIFIIGITIPVISISLISIRHSTEIIIDHVRQSSINSLSDRKNIIEQKMKEIDGIVYQVFNNKSLRQLQRSNTPSAGEIIIISEFITDLTGITIANELIDSIYVYDIKREFIIYDSKYGVDDFIDPEAIEAACGKEYGILRRRIDNNDVITCTYSLRNVLNNSDNIIIANINYSNLFNLNNKESSGIFETLIFNDGNSEILFDGNTLSSIDGSVIKSISDSVEASGLFNINGTEYFVCKVHSDTLGWTFAYLQPYSDVLREAAFIRKLTMSSLIIVLLLSFVLAYVNSICIYSPIGRLAKKVTEITTDEPLKIGNAYKSIDDAIIKLFDKNSELMSRYQTIFPYFKQYSVNDLLSGEIFDLDKFTNILNLLGIRFVYSRYVNVVIDFENTNFSNDKRELLESAFAGYKKDIAFILFGINSFRASMIINTDMKDDAICKMIEAVKKELNGKDIELTIAVGCLYDDIGKAYSQHREILGLINDKFFTGKNRIILHRSKNNAARKYVYDKKLEEELIACIINGQNEEGAVQVLDRLMDKIVGGNGSIEYIRYVYFQVISHIMEALDNIGIDLSKAGMSGTDIFENIQKLDTIGNIRKFAVDSIEKCVSLLDEYRKAQHEVIVDNVMEYLKSNFTHDITLNEVSKKVFLSPGYVNSIFRSATGCTIYEYVTKIRMEAAAGLLEDNGRKIQDIAAQVGYNNVQSFFRLFKKHYNMTPVEYRRKLATG